MSIKKVLLLSSAAAVLALGAAGCVEKNTAGPEAPVYTPVVNVFPKVGGTLERDILGPSYTAGTVVTVSAREKNDTMYAFTHWSWSGDNPPTTKVEPTENKGVKITIGPDAGNLVVTANFKQLHKIERLNVTDDRVEGGRTYKTVQIGDQLWMTENIDYPLDSSWCHGGDDENCTKYGRLYNWDAASEACPEHRGYRLPSSDDWDDLIKVVGGSDIMEVNNEIAAKVLSSATGWTAPDGTDAYGFAALPGGRRTATAGFDYTGERGYWWSSTLAGNDRNRAYYRYIEIGKYPDSMADEVVSKMLGYSVRCVGDN